MIKAKVTTEVGYDSLLKIIREEAEFGMDAAGLAITRSIAQQLNTSPLGKPSPIGMPPARQTGALGRSFSTMTPRQFRRRRLFRAISVQPNTFYGSIHELSPRFPRPFMRPGFQAVQYNLQRVFSTRLRRGIKSRIIKLTKGSA